MGKQWNSVLEARAGGSLCNFQIDLNVTIPTPGIPTITLPLFPPPLPTINLFCPFDEEDEEIPT